MLPMPTTSTIEDLLIDVQKNFKNQIKCSSVYLDSQDGSTQESLYSIDRSFKIGQCFRDCDKIVIKAENSSKSSIVEAKADQKKVESVKKPVEQKKPQQKKPVEQKKPVQQEKPVVKKQKIEEPKQK